MGRKEAGSAEEWSEREGQVESPGFSDEREASVGGDRVVRA